MQLHIFSLSRKGCFSLCYEKNAFCLKKGVFYWASKSAIWIEKGVFFSTIIREKCWGCFSNLGTSVACALVGSGGPGCPILKWIPVIGLDDNRSNDYQGDMPRPGLTANNSPPTISPRWTSTDAYQNAMAKPVVTNREIMARNTAASRPFLTENLYTVSNSAEYLEKQRHSLFSNAKCKLLFTTNSHVLNIVLQTHFSLKSQAISFIG